MHIFVRMTIHTHFVWVFMVHISVPMTIHILFVWVFFMHISIRMTIHIHMGLRHAHLCTNDYPYSFLMCFHHAHFCTNDVCSGEYLGNSVANHGRTLVLFGRRSQRQPGEKSHEATHLLFLCCSSPGLKNREGTMALAPDASLSSSSQATDETNAALLIEEH